MALALILVAALLIMLALVAWQHAQRTGPREVTFGIENAVTFITTRLDPETASRVGADGVRRIMEWEIFYLQGLAQDDRRHPVETVAGDYPPAVEFIRGEIARVHGRNYSAADIGSVLGLGVAYLQSIGAIGDEAGGLGQ